MRRNTALSRRAFLKAAAGGAMAAPLVRAQPAPDVVVIGAGAFGGWTALHLREMGQSVTLLDAYGPGNSRSASGGETRQIRAGYGDQELYSRWAVRALAMWRAREDEFGEKLLLRTGRLQLASDWNEELRGTAKVFEKLGIESEFIQRGQLEKRYPQMGFEGIEFALFEPGAGVLRSRFSMQVVADRFEKKGGTFRIARAEPPSGSGPRLDRLALSGGGSLSAGSYVFACGPWLPKVFPELLGRRIFTPRRDIFFFGVPSGDARFSYPNLPNFDDAGYYGFPDIDGRGFKLAPMGERVAFDPDLDERVNNGYLLPRARAFLARRFPALAGQPLVESRVCQTEMTVDENFIVEPHPDWSNVWIAGGGSGHGFKHGPVVGEYVARRVSGSDEEPELEALFRVKPEMFSESTFSGRRHY
jgi:glycine/D-amino acid oxidase-like deaminating enzyme